MSYKIAIIEDDPSISKGLKLILEEEGYIPEVYERGLVGLEHYSKCDILILDLMLPDIDGLEVLKKIRKESQTFPVLITSARSSEDDILKGLNLGADDYITKPFSMRELLMRIKRTIERVELYKQNSSQLIDSYNFTNGKDIDFKTLTANTNMGTKELTIQEGRLLHYMITHSGKIISREELMQEIWGRNCTIESRTVDNFIVRFRKYFENDSKNPIHFITKRGSGYTFTE